MVHIEVNPQSCCFVGVPSECTARGAPQNRCDGH